MKIFVKILVSFFIYFALIQSAMGSKIKAGDALKPSTSINFDERRVEAVNTRPLDAFHYVGEKRRDGRTHLYEKPRSFLERNNLILKSIGSH